MAQASDRYRLYLLAATGGGGASLGYYMLRAMEQDPKLIAQLVTGVLHWGPLFALCAALLYMLNTRMKEWAATNRESAVQQQRMADAMQSIADKNDREAEEQRRLTAYVGQQQDKVLEKLIAIDGRQTRLYADVQKAIDAAQVAVNVKCVACGDQQAKAKGASA